MLSAQARLAAPLLAAASALVSLKQRGPSPYSTVIPVETS